MVLFCGLGRGKSLKTRGKRERQTITSSQTFSAIEVVWNIITVDPHTRKMEPSLTPVTPYPVYRSISILLVLLMAYTTVAVTLCLNASRMFNWWCKSGWSRSSGRSGTHTGSTNFFLSPCLLLEQLLSSYYLVQSSNAQTTSSPLLLSVEHPLRLAHILFQRGGNWTVSSRMTDGGLFMWGDPDERVLSALKKCPRTHHYTSHISHHPTDENCQGLA